MIHRQFPLSALLWAALLACTGSNATAQIRTDASLGQAAQTLQGPAYELPEQLGKRMGGNLFHSFEQFNIGSGESAVFRTSSDGIRNVISRVTGGTASQINGPLALLADKGAPAFYFLNPAGVVFGQGAVVYVPGAFHVSTADGLRFPEGVWLANTAEGASTFSSADPVDFGFLAPGRGPVHIGPGAIVYSASGQPLSVVGGDITVDDGNLGSNEGGTVRVSAAGALSVLHGGKISSYTSGPAQAGDIYIQAASLLLDSLDASKSPSIASASDSSATGRTGDVSVAVAGPLQLRQGLITSSTLSSGDSGTVSVRADSIVLDGSAKSGSYGIYSYAAAGSGHAGPVQVQTPGMLELHQNARIASSTWAQGRAGAVQVDAGSLYIHDNAGIYSESQSKAGDPAHAGSVAVRVHGPLVLESSGYISTSTYSAGNAGAVQVEADSIHIDSLGSNSSAGILSSTWFDTGNAGTVDVRAHGLLEIKNGGIISTNTFAGGKAGAVRVQAQDIHVSGGYDLYSNISSDSILGNSLAESGHVQVQASGGITLDNGGRISASTWSEHDAGTVQVQAKTLSIDGGSKGISSVSSSSLRGNGAGGNVQLDITEHLSLRNGGVITTVTSEAGQAGSIHIKAGSLSVEGGDAGSAMIHSGTAEGSTGRAGAVQVQVQGTMTVANGGMVSSDTLGAGAAGDVRVAAGSLQIDGGREQFAIISSSAIGGSGDAGTVRVAVAGPLELLGGGDISSSTGTAGRAGSVVVSATEVRLDGADSFIWAKAKAGSSGQTGTVDLQASKSLTLTNGSSISILNDASVPNPERITPGALHISAPVVQLTDSQITAAASGNVDASSLNLTFGERLQLDNSQITTSSNLGNGGAISALGGQLLALKNSQITTSVLGTSGNGGDINVRSQALALNTGVIQANTAARDAAGGRVQVDVATLLPSAGALWVGGNTPYALVPGQFGLNVIQAAAPTGLSGRIDIAAPALDLSGALQGLGVPWFDSARLGHNPCDTRSGSTLAIAGRGHYPVASYGWLGLLPSPESPPHRAKAPLCLGL